MGNCKGKASKPKEIPTKSYEQHCVTKHHLRLGIQAGKDDKGELILGVKGGVDNYKDKIVKVGENSNNIEEDVNKIPKVLDVINDEQ